MSSSPVSPRAGASIAVTRAPGHSSGAPFPVSARALASWEHGDAGVMRFAAGTAYALRIESHNHPSPPSSRTGGTATGIGGILRDVLAVGGKPIALTDPLFFGPLDLPESRLPKGVKSPGTSRTGS